jgi:MFS transporter, AAHS family, 4-hydroxybenzoate transporter
MPSSGKDVNIAQFIDSRPLTRFQIGVVLCCALVNALDGLDTQSIGVAAPFIAKGLGIPLVHFGSVFSITLFGAVLGAIGFGPLADRVGRKILLVAATLIFGVFTLLTAFADSVPALMGFRFLAGIGLGGATPCFIALTSEYVPARLRSTLVTVMWAAFPLGGMIGGFLNSSIIAALGWRTIFYIGGTLPLCLAAVLIWYLPESIKFMLTSRNDNAAVNKLVARFGPPPTAPGTRFVVNEESLSGFPIRHLFTEGRALGTLLLWVPFFMGFGVLTVAVLWTPALLHLNGISPSATAFVVAFNGLGACFGLSIAGRLIERFGVVQVLVPAFVLGAAATVGLGYGADSVGLAAMFIGLIGLFLGIGTAGPIALSTAIYPTAIRSTGVGMGMGMARLGQVVGPLIAGVLLSQGWTTGRIMVVIGTGSLIGALFVALLKSWMTTQAARAGTISAAVPNIAE